MNWETMAVIAVLAMIIFLYRSSIKVKRTFHKAINNAKQTFLEDYPMILSSFYDVEKNPRHHDFKTKGLKFVLQTEPVEERVKIIYLAIRIIVATEVQKNYKYMRNDEIFRMLDKNKDINKKFMDTVQQVYDKLF